MTNRELISVIAKKNHVSQKEAKRFLLSLSETITENTTKGEKTHVLGLGTFDLGSRAQRRGRNPRTGEVITIPRMPMPIFRAGSNIKWSVRK